MPNFQQKIDAGQAELDALERAQRQESEKAFDSKKDKHVDEELKSEKPVTVTKTGNVSVPQPPEIVVPPAFSLDRKPDLTPSNDKR